MNGSKQIAKCVSVPGLTPLLDQTDGASDGIFCLCIGDCQFERRSTILAIKVRTHLRVNVEPSLPLGSSLMTRPPYAVARYDVGSLEVRLRYATWRRGREELCQKLRLMAR